MTLGHSVLAIVGPTASGKSSLAIELALRAGHAEVISVDSMQVYRHMDIGTATATVTERRGIVHHMIDVLEPEEECSVGWFQREARVVRASMDQRRQRCIYVGGTGLYHRAVVDDLEIPGRFPEVARGLEAEADTAGLYQRLLELDAAAAGRMEPTNRRRIIRALEVTLGAGRTFSSFGDGLEHYADTDVVMFGLDVDRAVLTRRINDRFDRQMKDGLLDEVADLLARPVGWSRTASQGLGYRELARVITDGADLDEAIVESKQRIRRFAVRQLRWFRRDPRIEWLEVGVEADASGHSHVAALADRVERRWITT